MDTPSPQEIVLTRDLLDYAKAVALQEAKKHCPPHVNFKDVIQEVHLNLVRNPPKHDPSRGASAKTLIHLVVQRTVLKFVARQCRQASRFKQFEHFESKPIAKDRPGKLSQPIAGTESGRKFMAHLQAAEEADDAPPRIGPSERRPVEYSVKGLTTDDVLQYVDCEESRELCRLVIECEGNLSEVARRLGKSEGTIRYRLKLLAPKLLAAGFNPFGQGELR